MKGGWGDKENHPSPFPPLTVSAQCVRLLEPHAFRIIHSLLEGTGSRPVGFAPTFSFVRETAEGDNGKRFDCSQGSGIS